MAGIPGVDPSGNNPNDFLQFINGVNTAGTQETQPKINSQGQQDIFGIGENSGFEFPTGTLPTVSDGPKGQETYGQSIKTSTPDEYLKQLMHLSQTDPSAFIELQRGLYDAGFYGDKATPASVGFGRWNAATKDALVGKNGAISNYIEMYRAGSTVDTFNDWMAKQAAAAKQDPYSPGNAGGSGSGFKGTSPADIQMQADAQSSQMLGHAMGASDSQGVVSDTLAQQQQAFNQGDVYMRSVTPQSVAREYILQNNLPEYAQHQAESYMNVFANMFLSGNSSRAQTSLGDAAIGG